MFGQSKIGKSLAVDPPLALSHLQTQRPYYRSLGRDGDLGSQ